MKFVDWLAKELGTRKWVVAQRWTDKLREKYEVRITRKYYAHLVRKFITGAE